MAYVLLPQHPVPIVRLLCLHADSRPECLTEARREIRRALDQTRLSAKGRDELEVAVGELLSNIHRHAYPLITGPLFVEVFNTDRIVTVVLIDTGCATTAPGMPPTLPDQEGVTGRGLYLVHRLTDEVKFSVNLTGHGLAVRVMKWLEPPRAGSGRHHRAHVDTGMRSVQQQRCA